VRRFEGARVVVATNDSVVGDDEVAIACARAFASEGAEVVLVASSPAVPADPRSRESVPGKIRVFEADPGDPSAVSRAVDEIAEGWDSVDVLVTHYLGGESGGIDDLTPVKWEETIRVCLTSVFLVTQSLLPLLRKADRAAIVNFG
jgi:NAD(P)-dependent dehydrogenase (short-subunit alcohol dehydrogenase family)